MQQASKFGIYLNPAENQVVRINSPYWLPEEPDWVFLTPEVNATLLDIRKFAVSVVDQTVERTESRNTSISEQQRAAVGP